MSVSTDHAEQKKWQQTWVACQGGYLHLVGEFRDGKMSLVNRPLTSDGGLLFRMVFYDIHQDSFDWDWERSENAG